MAKAIDRIMVFLNEINLSARQFDLSIGTANGYTLRMKKNNASVGSDVIEKIISTYPQINLVWLITGKGEMLVSGKKASIKQEIDFTSLEKLIEQKIVDKLTKNNKQIVNQLLVDLNKEITETKENIKQ